VPVNPWDFWSSRIVRIIASGIETLTIVMGSPMLIATYKVLGHR